MERFKKILLVLDGKSYQKAALTRGLELARMNQAELKIIDVLENPVPKIYVDVPSKIEKLIYKKQKLMDNAVRSRKIEIQNIIKTESIEDISVSYDVLRGKAYFEIIQEVLKFDFDLVIKNAEGKAGLMWGILGSDDIHLIRKCFCPVWLIKPKQSKKFNRVLAAIDIDPFSNDKKDDDFNKKIIQMALSIAQKDNSELHLLHVWDFIDKNTLNSWGAKLPGLELKKFGDWEKKFRKDSFDQLVSPFSLNEVKSKIHLIEGDPKSTIPKFVEKKKIDLLVMGTIGRSGIPGFFIGNTSEIILNKINCSLLAIKPDDFISPITLEEEC